MERLKRINPLHERFGYLGVVVLGIVVLLIGLLLRSDVFLTFVGVVLQILGWVGILGGGATVIAGIAAFGHQRGWWDRVIESGGRIPLLRGLSGSAAFLIVIIFFFLPWMSVSCFGDDVFTASGTDIMGITQINDLPSEVGDGDYGVSDALTSEAALLYLVVLLAVVGAALFFLPDRPGAYIRAGIAGAGILSLLAFVFLTLSSAASELGVGIGELGDAGIEISWKFGFWLALIGYIAAIVLQFVPLPDIDVQPDDG